MCQGELCGICNQLPHFNRSQLSFLVLVVLINPNVFFWGGLICCSYFRKNGFWCLQIVSFITKWKKHKILTTELYIWYNSSWGSKKMQQFEKHYIRVVTSIIHLTAQDIDAVSSTPLKTKKLNNIIHVNKGIVYQKVATKSPSPSML